MREMVQSVSDRVLTMFVPRAKASACQCAPDGHWEFAFCQNGIRYEKYCTYNCLCVDNCGAPQPGGHC